MAEDSDLQHCENCSQDRLEPLMLGGIVLDQCCKASAAIGSFAFSRSRDSLTLDISRLTLVLPVFFESSFNEDFLKGRCAHIVGLDPQVVKAAVDFIEHLAEIR